MQVNSTHRQEEMEHFLPHLWRGSAPSLPYRVLRDSGTSTSIVRNAIAAQVHLWPAAAHASARRSWHRSRHGHTSAEVSLGQKAELAARYKGRKVPADT